jgi:hypothetical protein
MIQTIRFKDKDLKEMFQYGKDMDPLTAFYEWLILESGSELKLLNGAKLDVSKVVINKTIYTTKIYDTILFKFAKKSMPLYSKERILGSLAMYDLELGPKTSIDIPDGLIILETGWLYFEGEK